MSEKETGGAAFPVAEHRNMHDEIVLYAEPGMTLRDYFAAKSITMAAAAEKAAPTGKDNNPTYKGVAERCYLLADAMIEARKV